MKIYYEARETITGEETESELIRLDVTGKTEEERAAILAQMEAVMSGITCTYHKHTCGHDEGLSCTMEALE